MFFKQHYILCNQENNPSVKDIQLKEKTHNLTHLYIFLQFFKFAPSLNSLYGHSYL